MRLAEMAEADESLREKQPWKAACEKDYDWLGEAITKHYHGDDADLKLLMAGILQAFAGQERRGVLAAAADVFLRGGKHPTLGRTFHSCGYAPMIELLALSRGERLHELHRVGRRPRLHAPGHRGRLRHPVRASDRQLERAPLPRRRARRHDHVRGRAGLLRRRPGQADPDLEPYRAAPDRRGRQLERRHPHAPLRGRQGRPALRLLVLHDDAEREFDYTAGAEESLEAAAEHGWTVVSIKNDWASVFA